MIFKITRINALQMVSEQEIIEFIKGWTYETAQPETDINHALGVDGDDFSEFIEAFAEKYKVDMSTYLWYFHQAEEGGGCMNFGAIFYKPPNLQVKRIPVTPTMLTAIANRGKWEIEYPTHQVQGRRKDIRLNLIFSVTILLLMLIFLAKKYFFE